MGIADLIPGVSGGTIAFITGIYDDLLMSLKSLSALFLLKNWVMSIKKIRLTFLLSLGCGIALSFLVFARLFYSWLTHPHYYSFLYALFFGLILASTYICLKEVKNYGGQWKFGECIALLAGILIALSLGFFPKNSVTNDTYFVPLLQSKQIVYQGKLLNYDKQSHTLKNIHRATIENLLNEGWISSETVIIHEKSLKRVIVNDLLSKNHIFHWICPLYIISGMVAISAMLLPGISGSYMLTVIGVYPQAIQSFISFTENLKKGVFDSSSLVILLNLLAGIILGLMLFSKVVSYLLKKHRVLTLIILIGFMVGSMPCIWPFWNVEYLFSARHLTVEMVLTSLKFPHHLEIYHLGLVIVAILGFIIVWGAEKISARKKILQA